MGLECLEFLIITSRTLCFILGSKCPVDMILDRLDIFSNLDPLNENLKTFGNTFEFYQVYHVIMSTGHFEGILRT